MPLPIQSLVRRLVILVQIGNHSTVPSEQLLSTRRLLQNHGVAQRADVVDLLLEKRARKLMIYGQAVFAGGVSASRMPKRRVKNEQRARRALNGNGIAREVGMVRFLYALVAPGTTSVAPVSRVKGSMANIILTEAM